MKERLNLPIDEVIPDILASLKKHNSLVLTAAPGAGKTTRVPPAIIRSDLLSSHTSQVLLLQPRRVAARATAERIASEQAWTLGSEIGYQIRFERVGNGRASLEILTEGILIRRLQSDPSLEGVGIVILDEFHERSLHLDLSIALLREIQESLRPDLKILVMSATVDTDTVSEYLGHCPILHAPGRLFPIHTIYSREPLPLMGGRALTERVVETLKEAIANSSDTGDVLVFLPGVGEIRRIERALQEQNFFLRFAIVPLFSQLSSEEQVRALKPWPKPKIILATNIAETSLTIDGVTTVIDTGLARILEFDARIGVETLSLSRISLASAKQREGRAGRQRPGTCYKLWMKNEELSMAPFLAPEINRVDLTDFVLALAQWGATPETLKWYERPNLKNLEWSLKILRDWNALESNRFQLTDTGRAMAFISLPSRLAKLVVEGSKTTTQEEVALKTAAILAERDFVPDNMNLDGYFDWDDDLEVRISLLKEQGAVVNTSSQRQTRQLLQQIRQQTSSQIYHGLLGAFLSSPDRPFSSLLLSAFPDRVVRRRELLGTKGLLASGRGVVFSERSVCRKSEYVLALVLFQPRSGAAGEPEVTIASPLDENFLVQERSQDCRERIEIKLTPSGKLQRSIQLYYREIPIGQPRQEPLSSSDMAEALTEVILQDPFTCFEKSPGFTEWYKRVEFAQEHAPTWDWCRINKENLEKAVGAWTMGKLSLADVCATSVVPYFEMGWSQNEKCLFDSGVPATIDVPSGSRLPLLYSPHRPPTLSVRLQEVFGWIETPSVLEGRVRVVLELLAPNFRPLQVTTDLRSFWSTTYHEIRGQLRARYPKHSWPDNPLEAKAIAKGRSQRGR